MPTILCSIAHRWLWHSPGCGPFKSFEFDFKVGHSKNIFNNYSCTPISLSFSLSSSVSHFNICMLLLQCWGGEKKEGWLFPLSDTDLMKCWCNKPPLYHWLLEVNWWLTLMSIWSLLGSSQLWFDSVDRFVGNLFSSALADHQQASGYAGGWLVTNHMPCYWTIGLWCLHVSMLCVGSC